MVSRAEEPSSALAADVPAAWERLFHRLAETALEGICTVDAEGIVQYVSPHLAEMLGYTHDSLQGTRFADLFEEAHAGSAPPPTREGKAVLLRRADGSRFWAGVATVCDGSAPADSAESLLV